MSTADSDVKDTKPIEIKSVAAETKSHVVDVKASSETDSAEDINAVMHRDHVSISTVEKAHEMTVKKITKIEDRTVLESWKRWNMGFFVLFVVCIAAVVLEGSFVAAQDRVAIREDLLDVASNNTSTTTKELYERWVQAKEDSRWIHNGGQILMYTWIGVFGVLSIVHTWWYFCYRRPRYNAKLQLLPVKRRS